MCGYCQNEKKKEDALLKEGDFIKKINGEWYLIREGEQMSKFIEINEHLIDMDEISSVYYKTDCSSATCDQKKSCINCIKKYFSNKCEVGD